MRHQNIVFHDLVKLIPWSDFDRLVADHHADRGIRQLSTKHQLLALLYAQLSGATSLRETVASLNSHENRLYHIGARPVTRSTFSDANAKRPADLFAQLFAVMAARQHRGLRKAIGEATYLIDSTGLKLSGLGSEWAEFSAMATGAKLHVIYDPDAIQPIYASVSTARVNDITAAQKMPISPGATYVFDLGYYDYDWWNELHNQGCRIVTRFKRNAHFNETAALDVPDTAKNILSDRVGLLAKRRSKGRANPFTDPVREVQVQADDGKKLTILTNDLDAPAQEIADLYKRRWQIELFFRWIKQNLKIRHFIGRSENAVRIQVAVALIAFLLLRIAHQSQKCVKRPLEFARLVRANLMHQKRIDKLIPDRYPSSQQTSQMLLI